MIENDKSCSFCGATGKDGRQYFISGNNSHICNICIDTAFVTSRKKIQEIEQPQTKLKKIPTPKKIKEFLDEYVIGQEEAKKTLSVTVYNHYIRLNNQLKLDTNIKNSDPFQQIKKDANAFFNDEQKQNNIEINKSNVLLLGDTGSGKTLLVKTLARILQVPIFIADATSLTEAGYVGDDVETVLTGLLNNADKNFELAEMGIVYIDEIDKLAKSGPNPSITKDVSGVAVQQALLKIIEGSEVTIPIDERRKHPGKDHPYINTENILFICGGAFNGLEDIIAKRVNSNSQIGIGFSAVLNTESKSKKLSKNKNLLNKNTTQDLIRYGLIPEFIGRFPITTSLNKLEVEDLIKILVEPKNSIVKQYEYLFSLQNVELKFTKEGLKIIAKKAHNKGTGARGLKSIVEDALMNLMYEIPSNLYIHSVTITKDSKNPKELLVQLKKNKEKRQQTNYNLNHDLIFTNAEKNRKRDKLRNDELQF